MPYSFVLLYIPHSSLLLPKEKLGTVLVPYERLEQEALEMADIYCDDLFSLPFVRTITARYSRLVCDVERYREDDREPMAAKGQGLFYTHLADGTAFRTMALRGLIEREVYDEHHATLTAAVDEILAANDRCLIIDCHSFSLPGAQPDICIGADDFHTPAKLVKLAQSLAWRHGCSAAVNEPYQGSIVPMKHYRADSRVSSVMIEINRRLYLSEGFTKSGRYETAKSLCGTLAKALIEHFASTA